MYLHKWNEALIEWALELAPKIANLGELQDGLFFHSLLKQVGSLDEGIDNDPTPNGFDKIYTILKKEFPLYDVCDIEKEEHKLLYISSLVLLLSVTKGKSPIFRSHLYENIQHVSQVKIRYFLESCLRCIENLDHVYLKALIEGDFIATESPASPRNTMEQPKTPKGLMNDCFDSPRLTAKLARDLRRLKNEYKVLLLEKGELEEELNSEKLKREHIQGNLTMRNDQVLKLREELQEFIQNTKVLEKKIYGNDCTMGIDRSKIKELESYIDKLTEEKFLLSEEKEELKKKLNSLQSKSKEFEIRALSTENINEELQAVLSQKNRELNELKEQYAELEEKICFLSTQHNTRDSDSSRILGSCMTSSFAGGECLSHVVEIKLAEVEEENEKLREHFKTTMDQQEILAEQLGEVKDKLEKAKIAQEAAKHEHIKIQDKLNDSLKKTEHLCRELDDAKTHIAHLQGLCELNQQMEDEIATLKKNISEKQQDLNKIKIRLDLYMNEKEILVEKNDKLNLENKYLDGLLSAEKKKSFKFNEDLKEVEKMVMTLISAIITKEDSVETSEMNYHLPIVDRINTNMLMLQSYDRKRESEMKMQEVHIRSLEEKVTDILKVKQDLQDKFKEEILKEKEEKIEHLTSQNNFLKNELEKANTNNEEMVKEILEDVNKIYQEKLLKMKEKLRLDYVDDLTEEKKMRLKLDESCKKYRDRLIDYEKMLSDATARNKDLMNKIGILNNQKSVLEKKLFDMSNENASDNIQNDFSSFGNYRSQSAEQVAEFFARGDTPLAKINTENNSAPDEISRAFSNESVHNNPTSGTGQLFSVEDEDGEMFNATYLADLKAGKCDVPNSNKDKNSNVRHESNYQNHGDTAKCNFGYDSPNKRMEELRRRNTLCLPHLKSSYSSEINLHNLKNFSEESIKQPHQSFSKTENYK